MSYLLTFIGFATLIILHEAGHFAAAKAVGMRVERFSLFFGRTPLRFRRGETEYGIGWIPAGGYVKITGMSPREELTPELEQRAYYRQPPWKRIVVILAGPGVNVVIAFVILLVIYMTIPVNVTRGGQTVTRGAVVGRITAAPARDQLRAHDRILSVDGHRIVAGNEIARRVGAHRCAGPATAGCRSATPVRITVLRDGRRLTLSLHPRYNATTKRMLVGIEIGLLPVTHRLGPVGAADQSIDEMWSVTSQTVSHIARLFQAQDRRQVHGIVGVTTVIQQEFAYNTTEAFFTLALISLSLAVVNLFPFLPLDGGHVFWAVAEKLRGRRISFDVMERAGVVGFVLIVMLFAIGLSNDISTLSGKGFNIH
jgi:regulator of sigma E protease